MNRYMRPIADLLERSEIRRLHGREAHHFLQTRLEHSLAVARLTYYTCLVFRANVRTATRAALLHDWYFESRDEHRNSVGADVHHYRIAAANAAGIGESPAVISAIETHMWPYGRIKPQSFESWIVWMADNVTWLTDFFESAGRFIRQSVRAFVYGRAGEYAA
jgi:uncharacterized protein